MRHVPVGNQAAWVEAPGTAPGSERFITTPVYHHSHPCEWHPEYRREGVKKKGAGARMQATTPRPLGSRQFATDNRGAALRAICWRRATCGVTTRRMTERLAD